MTPTAQAEIGRWGTRLTGGCPTWLRVAVIAAVVLSVAGIALAGIAADVPLWVLALLLAALGIGLGNTGSLGLLVEFAPCRPVEPLGHVPELHGLQAGRVGV